VAEAIVIIGMGGMAKEAADLVRDLGYEIEAFFTEPGVEVSHPIAGAPVVHDLAGVKARSALIAIGNTAARERLFGTLQDRFDLPAFVHPSACVSPHASVGKGALIMQNVVVSADAVVADGALLNVGCFIAHDCRVGAHVHVAPNVQMGGGSSVGDGTFCGTSSVILPNVSVGDWCIVGAGAVVIRDVEPRSMVVGVPARRVKTL